MQGASTCRDRPRAIRSSFRPGTRSGSEFAAADADCIFSRHGTIEAGQRFYEDVKGRLPRYGRSPKDLKILPAATFVLGETEAEALERSEVIRRQQVSSPTAILFLEQVWNRDLSAFDPDGPLPAIEPDLTNPSIVQGRVSAFVIGWKQQPNGGSRLKRIPCPFESYDRGDGSASLIGTPLHVANQTRRRSLCTRRMGSFWCLTSRPAASTSSPTRSSRSSRNGIGSALTTRVPRSRSSRACPRSPRNRRALVGAKRA